MSGTQNQYDIGLAKTPANFVALTPLSFLKRSAAVYPDHISAVYEDRVFTWSQTHARCRRLASFFVTRGIGHGDTVAAMLPNIPAMNELHFAVPMAGAVLRRMSHVTARSAECLITVWRVPPGFKRVPTALNIRLKAERLIGGHHGTDFLPGARYKLKA